MRILIAGGAGFIGSHLCERLLANNHEVICWDNLISSQESNLQFCKQQPRFQFENVDISKPLPDLKCDFIAHLASPASPNHHSQISYHALPMETMMANTVGTHQLLELAKKNEAGFLFTSTSEIYGDPEVPIQPETYNGNVSPVGPRSVYDESKRFGETLVAHYARIHKLDTRIVRIFNTYGPRIMIEDKRMLTNFIVQALKNEPITIYGDGQQTRSLCFIDDLIDGLNEMIMNKEARGEIINLGNPEEHTVLEYAQLVKKLSNSNSPIIFSEKLPQDDPKVRRPDLAKAKRILNWQPKISLETGLKSTIAYYKKLI